MKEEKILLMREELSKGSSVLYGSYTNDFFTNGDAFSAEKGEEII